MDILTNRLLRSAVPLFQSLAALLILVIAAAILILGKDVIIPLALALLLSFALSPIANGLERLGTGRGVAVSASVLIAVTTVAALAFLTYWQVSELARDLPNYRATINDKVKSIASYMTPEGPISRAASVGAEIIGENTPAAAKDTAPVVVVRQEQKVGLERLWSIAEPLLHPLATIGAVFLLTAFTLARREDLRNRIIRLIGTDDLQKTTAAIDDAANRVSRQLLAQSALNAGFGTCVALGLWLVGLPSPLLWGVIAAVARFIPYVGVVVGLVPPLLVAFAYDPTWSSFWWCLALFGVLEVAAAHVLEPLLYGKSTGISPVAMVLSAMVWAFLWGPVGLVLAAPLTTCLVVLGRHISSLAFIDILLGDRPALEPHEMFYQRVLAGDPREARIQAEEFLQQRSLATYYDEIALPALRRAHVDIVRGTIDQDRLDVMARSTAALVASLKGVTLKRRGQLSAEAQAAHALIRADHPVTRQALSRDALRAEWRGETPVAVLYGPHPLDEAGARMLAQVLTRQGLGCRIVPWADAKDNASPAAVDETALVCLSFVEPLSTLHLRAASFAVRRCKPTARIMLCIWQQTDDEFVDALKRRIRVRLLVTNTTDALNAAVAIATQAPPASRAAPRALVHA